MKISAIAASIAALGLAANAVKASEPTRTEAAPVPAEAQSLRVVRDKQTGKLRAPNADELKVMEAQERAARKARGLPEVSESQPVVVTRHASGMRSAVLGIEHMETLQATRRPDESLALKHDDAALEHPRSSAAPTAAPTE